MKCAFEKLPPRKNLKVRPESVIAFIFLLLNRIHLIQVSILFQFPFPFMIQTFLTFEEISILIQLFLTHVAMIH